MIMNQKFIIRLSVALALVLGTVVSAEAKKADANAYQDVKGPAITVSGVVTDAAGEPLPGASVMIKGTTTGTVTDLDGNYSLPVKQGQTLVVSYIGFKDQEFAASKTKNDIFLESDSTVLEDAVVVGYGSTKKVNLTGAVDQVTSKTFDLRPVTNVQHLLTGAMPNVVTVQTDGAPYRNEAFTIRSEYGSLGEMNAYNDSGVLVLIDGVEGDMELINPNDIESVSVLKDAASAAIYGSRGAQGVILITTKNPQKTEKVNVTYSGQLNIAAPITLPDLITDGYDYVNCALAGNMRWNNGQATNINNLRPSAVNAQTMVTQYKAWRDAGHLRGDDVDTSNPEYRYYGNTDWYDILYKDVVLSHLHNLTVNGSAGKVNYLLSGRFYDYSGLYNGDGDKYMTGNLRAKISSQITKWLKISENIEYTYDNIYMGVASTGEGLTTPERMLQTYGNPVWVPFNPDGTFSKAGAAILSGLMGDNAGQDVSKQNYKKQKTQVFRTTTALTVSLFNNKLRLNGDFTYRTKEKDTEKRYTNFYWYDGPDKKVDKLTNSSSKYKVDGKTVGYTYSIGKAKQAIEENIGWNNYLAANGYAEYENTWGKHYFKGMAGYNYEQRDVRDLSMRKRGISVDDLSAYAENAWTFAAGYGNGYKVTILGDKLSDKDMQALTLAGDGLLDKYENELKHIRNAGAFFRLNYSFDDRYLIEVDGRYDGTSYFAKGNQWAFFPAVSAGWRISQEPWWNVTPAAISNFKIRASFGELGDAASANAYTYEETLEPGTSTRVINGSTNTAIYKIPEEVKSSYSWSRIQTTDVGLDMGFFNGKLNLSADFFHRYWYDMLMSGPNVAATYGATTSPKGNYGATRTNGWEASLKYNDSWMVAGRPMAFSARFAIGDSRAFVSSYTGNPEGKFGSDGDNGQYVREGQELGELWGFKGNGLFQTQDQIDNCYGQGKPYVNTLTIQSMNGSFAPGDVWILDNDGDQKITEGDKTVSNPGDLVVVGNRSRRFPFNFGFSFDWYNFFLSASFEGIGHQDFAISGSSMLYGMFNAGYNPTTKWLANNTWTPNNTDALLPALSTGNKVFSGSEGIWYGYYAQYTVDQYLMNLAYVNLQNLQFGYNIPKKVLKKANIESLKIFFSGENLYNWSPFYKTYGRDFNVTSLQFGGDGVNPNQGPGLSWWETKGNGYLYPKLRTFSFGVSITL